MENFFVQCYHILYVTDIKPRYIEDPVKHLWWSFFYDYKNELFPKKNSMIGVFHGSKYASVTQDTACLVIRSFSGPYFPALGLNTERTSTYLSLFSPHAGRYRPEKLWIRTLFTKCNTHWKHRNYLGMTELLLQKFCWLDENLIRIINVNWYFSKAIDKYLKERER